MNYDDTIIGVNNSDHPANEIEIEIISELEEANKDTWKEKCAKWRLEEKVRNAEEKLNELLDYYTTQNKAYEKNKVTEILNILK